MESLKKPSYKYCFAPDCKNTSISTPNKNFFTVPRNELKRKAWCEAVGLKTKKLRPGSYCCEDHFDVIIFNLMLLNFSSKYKIYMFNKHCLCI